MDNTKNWEIIDGKENNNNYENDTKLLKAPFDGKINFVLSNQIDLSNTLNKNVSFGICLNYKLTNGEKFIIKFYNKKLNKFITAFKPKQGYTFGWKCYIFPIQKHFKNKDFRIALVFQFIKNTNDYLYIDNIKIGSYKFSKGYDFKSGTSMSTLLLQVLLFY